MGKRSRNILRLQLRCDKKGVMPLGHEDLRRDTRKAIEVHRRIVREDTCIAREKTTAFSWEGDGKAQLLP
jgi:hypothetical protein